MTYNRELFFVGRASLCSLGAGRLSRIPGEAAVSVSSFINIAVLAALALGAREVYGQSVSEVQFAPGASSAEVDGSITGDEYADFVLGAKAGQTMNAALTIGESSGNGTAYFNILPPGSDNVAIYIGSSEGNEAEVALPADGDYKVRVYQMGDDRDSGKTTGFTIAVGID